MKLRSEEQKFSERARELEEELEGQDLVDALRGSREAQEILQEEGWLLERTGVNVRGKRHWKKQREGAVDKHYFDFLLRDIIEAQVIFWKHQHGYEDEEQFIQDAIEGDVGASGSERNVAETLRWLEEDIGAPEELEAKQRTLGEVRNQ